LAFGFDVGDEDVSQLECAAQAAGGRYFDARDAEGLGAALETAAAAPVELPAARLSIRALANGKPVDAMVEVFDAGGERVAAGRTYTGPDTNPRLLPVEPGAYDVVVTPLRISGASAMRFDGLDLSGEDVVERTAEFGQAELAVGVTRNGALSDATVTVVHPGTGKTIASGRSYIHAGSNPRRFQLPPGTYDVRIGSVEIASGPSHVIEGVRVGGGPVLVEHAFASGELRVGVTRGAELVDAVVSVSSAERGGRVAGGRTYTSAGSNPKVFVLPVGRYRVVVKVMRSDVEGSAEIAIAPGDAVEYAFDVPAP
jgi:Ca-activated chloride channel family protein